MPSAAGRGGARHAPRATIPTSVFGLSSSPMNRRPTGFGSPGQSSWAAFSERTATPCPRSLSSNARPRSTAMLIARKYPGLAYRLSTGWRSSARLAVAFEVNRVVPGLAARGQVGDDSGGLDTGDGADLREKPVKELFPVDAASA